jgi:sulfatase modifying factor 1
MRRIILLFLCFLLVGVWVVADLKDTPASSYTAPPNGMVLVEGGWYTPLYKEDGKEQRLEVEPFFLDQYQVTNQEYLAFITAQPKWQAQHVSAVFADQGYLTHMNASTAAEQANQPVTHISWYAAMDYCKTQGKTLPSLDQWEFAAQASDVSPTGIESPEFKRKILDWYAKPATDRLPDVQQTEMNYWGVYGMHGVVWELVSDFNSTLVTGESRGDSALDKQLFCGSGAVQAVDPGDYAAFMRYALRSSYVANYTLSTMGFRCAKGR